MYNSNFNDKTFLDSLRGYKHLTSRDTDTLLFRMHELTASSTQSFPLGFFDVPKTIKKIMGENGKPELEVLQDVLKNPALLFKAYQLPVFEEKAPSYDADAARTRISPYLQIISGRRRNDPTKRYSKQTIEELAIPAVEKTGPRGFGSASEETSDNASPIKRRTIRPASENQTTYSGRPVARRSSFSPKSQGRMPTVLPSKEAMGDATNAHYAEKKSYPGPKGDVTIEGTTYKWSTLLRRFQEEYGETLIAYAKKRKAELEQSAPKREKPDFANPKEAIGIFLGAAGFIRRTHTLPDPTKYHHFIGIRSVADIEKDFKKGAVPGLEAILPEGTKLPNCMKDFLVCTGLAEKLGREIIPAPIKVIEQLVKTYS